MNEISKVELSTKESPFRTKYDNFINGGFRAPNAGKYFDNVSPVTGGKICEIARSDASDINDALDAAHAAKDAWGKSSVTDRANMLLKIADIMEENLELLAICETWDNGKAIRETRAADLPLAIDHFRYFASVIRAEEGTMGELD
ncbi:MAG: aldehyde dehydrogenase family protein, partial [Pseudomonadota bacterium]